MVRYDDEKLREKSNDLRKLRRGIRLDCDKMAVHPLRTQEPLLRGSTVMNWEVFKSLIFLATTIAVIGGAFAFALRLGWALAESVLG